MLAAAVVVVAAGAGSSFRVIARAARAGARAPARAAPPRTSSTSPTTSTPSATTSAAPRTRRSRSSSTATTSARTAARPRSSIRELLDSFGDDLRYVWRHLPLNDVHPNAQMAAEAAEAAAAQGAFWEMHDLLLAHQDELTPARPRAATPRSSASTSSASGTTCAAASTPPRVAEDVASADAQRRRRHADVLHQRPAPPGRLRRADADRRGDRRRTARPGPGDRPPLTRRSSGRSTR